MREISTYTMPRLISKSRSISTFVAKVIKTVRNAIHYNNYDKNNDKIIGIFSQVVNSP